MIGGVDANRKTKADANYTIAQWDALHLLVRSLLHNNIEIQTVIGHRDVSNKACPCFDVGAWAESLMEVQCVRSK